MPPRVVSRKLRAFCPVQLVCKRLSTAARCPAPGGSSTNELLARLAVERQTWNNAGACTHPHTLGRTNHTKTHPLRQPAKYFTLILSNHPHQAACPLCCLACQHFHYRKPACVCLLKSFKDAGRGYAQVVCVCVCVCIPYTLEGWAVMFWLHPHHP